MRVKSTPLLITALILVTLPILYFRTDSTRNSLILLQRMFYKENIPTPSLSRDSDIIFSDRDQFGIRMLNQTTVNGKVWVSNWNNGHYRDLRSGERDPDNNQFIARGNGTVTINGSGIAQISGDSPRMYVYDQAKKEKWNNVEVTIYAKRVSESGRKSSQGFVIGVRSEHQDANEQAPCLGRTYYGRLLYDGRAVFQKEVVHEGAYSVNMPNEDHKALWDTTDGSLPQNRWVGIKYVVKTNSDRKSVGMELYRDLTDGENGGNWEKVAEYIDNGKWSQTDTGIDVQKVCGYPANSVLLDPGTSVFIRNDLIKTAEYKFFSIREI